jgi:hypothetical protein
MKNIHVLPTDKASRLHTYKGVLNLAADEFVAPTIVKNDLINLNIYITSDEEIKDDWCYDMYNKVVFKNTCAGTPGASKKIILTTDQDLIKDGVQAIDDEFLEWFVKNPSCEWVEVDTYAKKIGVETDANGYREMDVFDNNYKIIIPKEKPKEMSKPTVVQYLLEVLRVNAGIRVIKQFQEEVLQMEKQMIIDAYLAGYSATENQGDSEQYYNENYKNEEK